MNEYILQTPIQLGFLNSLHQFITCYRYMQKSIDQDPFNFSHYAFKINNEINLLYPGYAKINF